MQVPGKKKNLQEPKKKTKHENTHGETRLPVGPFFILSYKYVWTNRAGAIINMAVGLPNGGSCALTAWILRDRMAVHVWSHHLPTAVDQFVTRNTEHDAQLYVLFSLHFFPLVQSTAADQASQCSPAALC